MWCLEQPKLVMQQTWSDFAKNLSRTPQDISIIFDNSGLVWPTTPKYFLIPRYPYCNPQIYCLISEQAWTNYTLTFIYNDIPLYPLYTFYTYLYTLLYPLYTCTLVYILYIPAGNWACRSRNIAVSVEFRDSVTWNQLGLLCICIGT